MLLFKLAATMSTKQVRNQCALAWQSAEALMDGRML